jgi:anti-anti-sigma factor
MSAGDDSQERPGSDSNVTALIEALQHEALRQSEARWRGYFEMSAVGVAVISPVKGWIEVNEALCKMLGYTREEFQERTWAALTHPDDVARDLAQFSSVMTGETDGYEGPKRLIHKDGHTIDARVYGRCMRRDDGSVEHFTAFVLDTTVYMETQRRLAASEAALLDKLATIEAQKRAIEELSAPILEVWEGVLAVPIVGSLDHARAAALTERLLARIAEGGYRAAIVDVTALSSVDEAVAGHLRSLFSAVRLLGARPIVTGIQPDVARAIIAAGLGLFQVETRSTMREAIARCMEPG